MLIKTGRLCSPSPARFLCLAPRLPRSPLPSIFPPVSSPAPLPRSAPPPAPAALCGHPQAPARRPLPFSKSSVERKETKNKPAPPLPVKTRPEKSPGQPPSQPAASPAAPGSLPRLFRPCPADTGHAGCPEPPARGRARRGAGGRADGAWGRAGGWAGGSRSEVAGPVSAAVTASSYPAREEIKQ